MAKVIVSRGIGVPDGSVTHRELIGLLESDPASHFTDSLAQNASEQENLTGLKGNKIKITGMALQATQGILYRVSLFGKDTFTQSVMGSDSFKGSLEFDLQNYGLAIDRLASTGPYATLRPNSDEGSPTGLFIVPNDGLAYYLKVDEATPDDDTSYLWSEATPGYSFMFFKVGAMPIKSTPILGVKVTGRFAKLSTSIPGNVQASAAILIKTQDVSYPISIDGGPIGGWDGVDSTSAVVLDQMLRPTTSYVNYSSDIFTHPVSPPWTEDDLSKLQIGIALRRSESVGITLWTKCTQLYVDVYYGITSLSLDSLNIPYEDLDGTKELHAILKNLSPVSKEAGSSGLLVLRVRYGIAG